MSEEGQVIVSAEEWNKLQERRAKLGRQLARVASQLARVQEQVDADNHSFAVAFLVERRKRQDVEAELAALRVIANEQKRQLRRRYVKRKLDFTE